MCRQLYLGERLSLSEDQYDTVPLKCTVFFPLGRITTRPVPLPVIPLNSPVPPVISQSPEERNGNPKDRQRKPHWWIWPDNVNVESPVTRSTVPSTSKTPRSPERPPVAPVITAVPSKMAVVGLTGSPVSTTLSSRTPSLPATVHSQVVLPCAVKSPLGWITTLILSSKLPFKVPLTDPTVVCSMITFGPAKRISKPVIAVWVKVALATVGGYDACAILTAPASSRIKTPNQTFIIFDINISP